MKRLVIYTCVTGDYDTVRDPLAVHPDADYVCYSTCPPEGNVWRWRPVPGEQTDAALASRWPKINPHELFPEYKYSLWMDANVVVAGKAFLDRVDKLMDKGVLYAGICHPFRDDLYEESVKVIANSRESLPRIMRAISKISSEGFPAHFGLMENNVILRAHNDPAVIGFDRLWWSFLQDYTYRDQISQGYCLWKTGLPFEYLLPKGVTARNSADLMYFQHKSVLNTDRSIVGRWNAYRADIRRIYYRLWLNRRINPESF